MIKVEKVSVMNFENAIRGARNPMNSWDKSDSYYDFLDYRNVDEFVIGENDMKLLKSLCKAGSDHRKFMRQIFVSMGITAPLYWWKEYDTYKVGTTANSCSTMHKIHSKEFKLEDFSHENLIPSALDALQEMLDELEYLRYKYNETKDKKFWYSIIQLLPSSYDQMRTCSMTFENLRNMYHARKTHKLQEWLDFCKVIETLSYSELIIE